MLRSVPTLLLVGALLGACADLVGPDPEAADPVWVQLDRNCAADAPAFSLPTEKLQVLAGHGEPPTPDAHWAAIARRVPGGFGGYYIDQGTGVLTVFLTDLSVREAALQALGAEMPDVDFSGAVVRKGRWNFAQLFDWQRYLLLQIYDGTNVMMADIEEVQNRLWFGVKDETARIHLTEELRALQIPCFLVAAEIVGPIEFR